MYMCQIVHVCSKGQLLHGISNWRVTIAYWAGPNTGKQGGDVEGCLLLTFLVKDLWPGAQCCYAGDLSLR